VIHSLLVATALGRLSLCLQLHTMFHKKDSSCQSNTPQTIASNAHRQSKEYREVLSSIFIRTFVTVTNTRHHNETTFRKRTCFRRQS